MGILQRSLMARLLTYFLLLALVSLVAVGFLAYNSGRQSIVKRLEAHLESVAMLKGQEIEEQVEHMAQNLNWLAATPQVQDAAATLATHNTGDPAYLAAHESLTSQFRRIAALGHLSPLFFLDSTSGEIIASSEAAWEGKFRESEPYFIQEKSRLYISDIFDSLSLGKPTMVASAPVKNSSGQLLGVLAGHLNLEHLNEVMLERTGLGETGETYLVNSNNLMLTDSRFQPGFAFKKQVFTEGVSRALEGETGVAFYTSYRGEPVIGAYRWLEDSQLVLLAEVGQVEAFAPINQLRNMIAAVIGFMIVIGAGISLLFARGINQPIKQLLKATEEVARGNLRYRLSLKNKDEIGQLGTAFNQMAGDIEKSEKSLRLSERRYRGVFENAGEAIITFDRAEVVQSWNRAAEEMFGYKAEEIVGHTFHSLVPADLLRQGELEQLRQEAEETAKIVRYETQRIRKNGTRIEVALTRSALRDDAGNIIGFMAILNDITKRKKAEEEIENIFNLSLDMLCIAGLDGYFKRLNPAFEKTLGYTNQELLAKPFLEFVHPKDRAATITAMQKLSSDISVIDFENRYQCKDGSSKWLTWAAIPHVEEGLIYAVARDTTESKQMQERLLASERLATLGQFSGNISHEIRNPLGVIGSSVYYLKTRLKGADEKVQEHLDRIKSGVDSATAIVESLLNLTRMKEPHLGELDLMAVIREAITTSKVPAKINVIQNFPEPELWVNADWEQLRMALANIVKNAVEAMDRKGTLTVTVHQTADGQVEASFADTGAGIAAENLDRVFQPLFSTKADGIGFGLSIAKLVVDKHGGTIKAKSAPGEGAVIIVSLPLYAGKGKEA